MWLCCFSCVLSNYLMSAPHRTARHVANQFSPKSQRNDTFML